MSVTQDVALGETRMLIDGELVEATSGRTFANVNPATEETIGQVADGAAIEMDRAIAAARRAFDETDWSTNYSFRKRCLEQLQEALESEHEQFRAELVAEAGTPVAVTYMAQLDWPLVDGLLWPAKEIEQFAWERELPQADLAGMPSRRLVWKEAVGVVGAIVPWNYPFEVLINKLGPILATGNTVVVKPAPDTPWSATRIGRLIAEKTDIPAGVVNIVTSSDHLVGELLTLDPRVDLISFTGSTVTGKRIMEKGAATLKRVFLELGGKSAAIILDDADFASTVPAGMSVCMHAGQGCAMQTRMLLPRSRYDEGVELITAAMRQVPWGDPTDPSMFMGPLISARQHERVTGLIRTGIEEGAKLVVGGPDRPAGQDKGFFVEPTLFVDVDNAMTIAQEEIFGPVLAVIPYDDDDDAVRIANDSRYGLSGAVHGSPERAMSVARRVRTGSLSVNNSLWYGADSPYGGYKTSGLGRQNGIEGFEQYLETKSVSFPVQP